jgi:hypothetical protein
MDTIDEIDILAEVLKRGAADVGSQFTAPGDEWVPVGIGVQRDKRILVSDLPLDKMTTEELFLYAMPECIRRFGFIMLGIVVPALAFVVEDPDDDLRLAMKGGVEAIPEDRRFEVLNLTVQDKYETQYYTAKVVRFSDSPPLLGAWERVEIGESWITASIHEALQHT